MKYTFKIFRYDPVKDGQPSFQEYPYESREKRTILEALMDIRNEHDATLSFRYSCREAVCGSCGMVINGRPELACRTMVDSLDSPLIILEPLPNMEIQKDLIVDMEPFWNALGDVHPYLVGDGKPPEKEHRIEDKEMTKIERYTTCILCACCYAACPVVTRDARYLGPIALAKLYRFVQDPRDTRPFADWARINTGTGIWGCDTVFACNEACPKDVQPAHGIEALRRKFVIERLKKMLRLRK
jgi:succinate dehydrogenase / fumarate reductase iron-sulfur subunit